MVAESISGLIRRRAPANVATAALSLALLVYVALRAATLSITHDEALTYAWHVTGSWNRIVLYKTPGLPDNNHVLHTLLCKVSVTLFGLSELTLRLPSLLGCLLYLVGLNRCLWRLTPGWGQVLGIFAVGLNPYVVDYFCVARGYGLGLGLTMVGLATLLAALCDRPGAVRDGYARASVLLFALAALANLAFLLVLAAALVVLCASLALPAISARAEPAEWRLFGRRLLGIFAPALPLLGYMLLPLLRIRKAGLFQIGGKTGFWTDTVGSLVEGTVYGSAFLAERRIWFDAWIVATLLLTLPALALLWRTSRRRFIALAVVMAMVTAIALGSVAQHWLFDVAFLQSRRGIVLIPLFMLSALALSALPREAPRWLAAAGMAVGAVAPAALGAHEIMAANFQYVLDWKYDAASHEMMRAVKAWMEERKPLSPVHMRVDWILEPSGNFYRKTLGIESSLLPLDRDGVDGPADLYYTLEHEEATIAKFGVTPLLRSPVANTVLLQHAP